MIEFTESICPLCSAVFPHDELHQHIVSDDPRLRERTIKVIQAYHPGWVKEDGACGPCWRSYRNASQVLNIMRNVRPRNAAA